MSTLHISVPSGPSLTPRLTTPKTGILRSDNAPKSNTRLTFSPEHLVSAQSKTVERYQIIILFIL